MLGVAVEPVANSRPSRSVLVAFLGVAFLSTGLLTVLGWLLVHQDGELEETRRAERHEQALDRLQGVVDRIAIERLELTEPEKELPVGTLLVSLQGTHVSVKRGVLLYFPYELPSGYEAPSETFVEGEQLEFAAVDLAGAGRAYARLTSSPNLAVRAGALGRLARVQRKAGAIDDALGTYQRMDDVDETVIVESFPATLYAQLGQAVTLEKASRRDGVHQIA
jgi:hypothetical protein